MKKTMLAALFSCSVFLSMAQGRERRQAPPEAVKEAFEKKFPGVIGKWATEKGQYAVNFKENGKTTSVTISNKGDIVETSKEIGSVELPEPIWSYVTAHFTKGIREAAKIVKSNGTVNYAVEVNGRDLVFDADGAFMYAAK